MIILGIETSCDETACGIVEIDEQQNCTLLANVVFSSMDLHKVYGGVVPEIAARSHIESIIPVIEQALYEAFESRKSKVESRKSPTLDANPQLPTPDHDPWSKIDAIAVTYGAGLGGSLLVGVMTARTLAITKNKPLYAINHVEAHVYANFITKVASHELRVTSEKKDSEVTQDSRPKTRELYETWQLGDQTYTLPIEQPQFPLLALIVSGGHTQLVLFQDHFNYILLGRTRDDAIGEAFDKVAKIIGLPYPGGPSIAKAAMDGDPTKYSLPKARLDNGTKYEVRTSDEVSSTSRLLHRTSYDFSFSGLKTAVLRLAQQEIGEDFTFPSFNIAERLSERQKADIAASFQRVALETVVDKAKLAVEEFQPKSVVIAGGVAASSELRRQLAERLSSLSTKYDVQSREKSQKSKTGNSEQETQNSSTISTTQTTSYQPPTPTYTDIKLCTDNGAMIATLGAFKAFHNQPTTDPYSLDIHPDLSM